MAAFFMMECEERPFDRVVAPTSWRNSTTLSIRILSQLPLVKVNHNFQGNSDSRFQSHLYFAVTDRSDSWEDEESATRRCSASRWATESSNTWLWQIDTKQHNKQSTISIRRAPSQSGYQGHFQGRQGWEKRKCIFIAVTACLSFFIQIFPFPFLPYIPGENSWQSTLSSRITNMRWDRATFFTVIALQI